MASTLKIQFAGVPDLLSTIALNLSYSVNTLSETFLTVRTGAYQSTIGSIEISRNEYINAFNADYNGGGLFTVLAVSTDEIYITHPNSGFFTIGNLDIEVGTNISFVGIDDVADIPSITITDADFSEADSDVCNNVKVDITTDVLATIVSINGIETINPNVDNPFSFDWIRGDYIAIGVENAEGETSTRNLLIPQTLSASNTTISIVNSPSGATVTTTVLESEGLDLEYSIDDITYQTSNVFSSITAGTYKMYVRDQLGCSIELDFTVDSFEDGGIGVQTALADLPSKSNSIRFAKRVTWGDCKDYKNDENTLSCELAYTQNPREVNQLFQDCDVITTQIRSNYETITTTIIQEDGTEILVPVDQKTSNIGLKDKRDAIKYNVGNNQTGVYFTSGDTYDYDTDIVNGTYALNGGLPNYGSIGNYLLIDTAWFQIVSIIFDEDKNAEVLIIDEVYTGVDVAIVVGSIYNLQEYEVYEFTIDMGIYPSQKIQVNITETDSVFDDAIFLSEIIDVKTRHENTVEIKYYNDNNTDIFYSTGIEFLIRIPIDFISGGFTDENENEKTDINTYLINSEVYELDEFNFDLLSKQLMRKVIQALSHKFVSIDGVGYVKNDSPTLTPLVGTNLYRLIASMIKSENVYTTNGTGDEFIEGSIEVPSLLEQASGGFIKWTI